MTRSSILTSPLAAHIQQSLVARQGWMGFDEFMTQALYAPGLGYYVHDSLKFGALPYTVEGGERVAGSDFVTAPEMSALFGRTVAAQIGQALQVTRTQEVWEFGAGSGALALQVLDELTVLGGPLPQYRIVDLSGSLRARQQAKLVRYGDRVQWVTALPESIQGVVLGNEVLDAMPVKLLARVQGEWFERGVVQAPPSDDETPVFAWEDRPTDLRPPLDIEGEHDYLTEIHPQGDAFVATLADKLTRGAIFLIDYGFPESEYYHPQRHMGTVMCHLGHRADPDPLVLVGLKDITAHVNFTGVALAAQDAGLEVLGYTSQAHFLMNCGLIQHMEKADLPPRVQAQKLIMEHEMGELFKVIGLCKGEPWEAMGFSQGDRTHRL